MKNKHILIFFLVVLALLACVCWLMPRKGLRIGSLNLRTPTLSSICNPQHDVVERDTVQEFLIQQYRDSIDQYIAWKDSSDNRFWFPNDDESFFDDLFAAMETAAQKGRWLRVLHYGDSQIELDHISGRLRSNLQDLFGGSGPGLLPLQSYVPTPIATLWSSRDLTRLAPFGDDLSVHSRGNYGLLAQCSRLDGAVTTQIQLSNNKLCDPRISECHRVGVIYHPRSTTLNTILSIQKPYKLPDAKPDKQTFSSDKQVGLSVWLPDSVVSRIKLSLNGSADIYAVLLDGMPGIMVDNIPLRGCSGYEFTKIDSTLLADAYSLLDIGLIILEFGGNALSYLQTEKGRANYSMNIGKQIDRIHHCCPKATILFVGPADMGTSINGSVQSYAYIESVVASLRDTVVAHGAAYWSQYDAMGGSNSMKRWVKQGLASSDYIHFTQKGADKMGDILSEAFKVMYQYYQLRRRQSLLLP